MRRIELPLFVMCLGVLSAPYALGLPAQPATSTEGERVFRISGAAPAGQAAGAVETVTFSIYAEETGGAALWQETQNLTIDASGQYSVLLGATSVSGLPVDLFAAGQPRWLATQFNGAGAAEETRSLLTSVPYALMAAKASDADTLGGLPASAFLKAAAGTGGGTASTVNQISQTPAVTSGTTGTIGKFTSPVDIGDSIMFENAGRIGVGTSAPLDILHSQFTNTTGTLTGFSVRNLGSTATSFSGMLFYDHTGALGLFQGFNNSTKEYRINNVAMGGSINFLQGVNSRFLVDAGGNIGMGQTSPSYKLDVLHGGGPGLRVQSSASFSALDIDAFSGDAALRFQKAGVGMWNLRNRPTDDYLEVFELGGGGSRMVIQAATGNVGIGQTTSPSYRLDVLHAGGTGIRSQSSASFSVVDIDAFSGDAALRFQKAGVGMWNTRNEPTTDNWQVFELSGGGQRLAIEDATGNVIIGTATAAADRLVVEGNVRVGTGTNGYVKDADGTVLTGTCSSDLRFKKNITPFASVLDRFASLTPVNFFWRASEFAFKKFGTRQSFGLVAQEVQPLFPDLVSTDEDGYLAVNYSKLPLLTIQAVKELKAQNDQLKAKNDSLEARLVALESAIKGKK